MAKIIPDSLSNKWGIDYDDTSRIDISAEDIQEPSGSQIGLLQEKFPESFLNQQYPFRYFTGAQARLFIEDVHLDEAVSIQYIAQAPVIPLYAYDNCKYIRTARGKSIVQGQILINFVDEGYLHYVLKDIRTNNFNFSKEQELAEEIDRLNRSNDKLRTTDELSVNGQQNNQKQIEENELKIQDLTKEKRQLASSTGKNLRAALDIIKSPGASGKKALQEVTKANLFPSAIQHENVVYDKMFFDMALVFGEEGTSVNTYKLFEDCQFVSNSLITDINSGQHIAESYGFIARRHQ